MYISQFIVAQSDLYINVLMSKVSDCSGLILSDMCIGQFDFVQITEKHSNYILKTSTNCKTTEIKEEENKKKERKKKYAI